MMLETHWHWHTSYLDDLQWQQERRSMIVAHKKNEALLFSEHKTCITQGKRGGHIEKETDIPIYSVNRGGLATAHEIGQLVLYPIINIQQRSLGTKKFICGIEASVIALLQQYGIHATRKERHPGIWIGDKKIASLGLEIKNGISIHGCALNVHNDLSAFQNIRPCGFSGEIMTSIYREISTQPSLYHVGRQWKQIFLQWLLENSS